MQRSITVLATASLLVGATAPSRATAAHAPQTPAWDARLAEHLLNRAAFGATPEEIAEVVALGREAAVERLLADAHGPGEPVYAPWPLVRPGMPPPPLGAADSLEPGEGAIEWQDYLREMGEYLDAWVNSMVEGRDPLRDRMAIFWHNHFVSGFTQVGDAHAMVLQANFLRAHGMGPFRVLVDGMSRDPAMLEYLDNNLNVRAHPNENWARELMELFTLGEGNYTEDDIKEAARAFTGWTEHEHAFRIDRTQHDFGVKQVLGVHGNLDGDLVADVLLEQPACAEWLAWKLLAYFEGSAPAPERLADYAQSLRASDYDVAQFLRRLFLDDAFYRDEIVGARVTGPIDYLVGAARRSGADVPPQMIYAGAELLGQQLLDPPSVKGWEGGMTWLSTAAVLNRSNLTGAMLGLVDLARLKLGGGDSGMEEARIDFRSLAPRDPMRLLVGVQATGWLPELDLTRGLGGDPRADARVLLERLLAREPDASLVERVAEELAHERREAGLAEDEVGTTPEARLAHTRVAHLVLSLPEAMLD